MSRSPLSTAFALTAALFTAALLVPATPAQADEGWSWWDAVYAQQNHRTSCPATGPTRAQWESAIGTAAKPDTTELTVFFIAYPCGGTPARFMEFRAWLNYEVHGIGTYDEGWEAEAFYDLRELVWELDEVGSGFWTEGPWQ